METGNFKQKTSPQEAWQQMSLLLDAEMPVEPGDSGRSKKYIAVVFVLLFASCGIYQWLDKQVPPSKRLAVMGIAAGEGAAQTQKATTQKPLTTNSQHTTTLSSHRISTGSTSDFTTENRQEEWNGFTDEEVGQTSANSPSNKETDGFKAGSFDGPAGSANNQTVPQISNEKRAVNKAGKIVAITKQPVPNVDQNPPSSTSAKQLTTNDVVSSGVSSHIPQTNITIPVIKKSAFSKDQKRHFGLQWELPLQVNNKTFFTQANTKNNAWTLLIPSFWISKDVSRRSTLTVTVNPNAQYFLNKDAAFEQDSYTISSISGSGINLPERTVLLTQQNTVAKVIGVETALQYEYKLTPRFTVGAALAGTQTTGAVFTETVVKNSTTIIKDSVYGVIKRDDDWKYVNSLFASGKINVAYKLKRFTIGAAVSKAISPVYKSAITEEKPVNMQLYLRWKIM